MFRKCCVSNCNSLRQDVNLHKIPANEEMKSQWLMCLSGCIDSTSVSSNMHVCHKHFERRFVNARTNHLKTGAYPTLFSDLEISSGYPSNVHVTDANVPSEGQFVHVASSNIAQLTVAELVEPSSSSLTEINTFASTSSQEATTGAPPPHAHGRAAVPLPAVRALVRGQLEAQGAPHARARLPAGRHPAPRARRPAPRLTLDIPRLAPRARRPAPRLTLDIPRLAPRARRPAPRLTLDIPRLAPRARRSAPRLTLGGCTASVRSDLSYVPFAL
ncbi:hypothetical protein ACJJTC_000357 [Scirpophaga incertulas]